MSDDGPLNARWEKSFVRPYCLGRVAQSLDEKTVIRHLASEFEQRIPLPYILLSNYIRREVLDG